MSSAKTQQRMRDLVINGTLLLLVFIWTIPTLGLLISSFRTRFDIQTSGWWKVLPHREWIQVEELDIPEGADPDGIMTIEGVTGTFDEFREGITAPDGRQIVWSGNKRLATIRISDERWVILPKLTLENYGQVLAGKTYEIQTSSGEIMTVEGDNFVGAFLNSITVCNTGNNYPDLNRCFCSLWFCLDEIPWTEDSIYHSGRSSGDPPSNSSGPNLERLC